MEETNKNIESLKEDTRELSKKIDDSIEDSNKNMELLNKKMEENTEMISKRMEENNEKINTKIEEEITGVRREISKVHERCELNSQEIQQAKEDIHTRMNYIEENNSTKFESIKKKQEDLTRAQTNFGVRCEEITATVNDVRVQVYSDKEKMAEVQQREFNNFREMCIRDRSR